MIPIYHNPIFLVLLSSLFFDVAEQKLGSWSRQIKNLLQQK